MGKPEETLKNEPSSEQTKPDDGVTPYEKEDFQSGLSMKRVNQNGFPMDYPFDYVDPAEKSRVRSSTIPNPSKMKH